ncbi:MAG: chemotaxis protein CheB [Micavibrio sp.]|nr:chemotaxis protein CheB [Micavibrio sp.]
MRAEAKAVVIGASAGAVEALSALLPKLPERYSLPVMVVVHMPPDKDSIIAELFQAKSKVIVKEAEDKEAVRAGTVYFAPPDYHLLVEEEKILSLSNDELVHFSRPSIDVLFESAAYAYGAGLVGIVLTGANSDGAAGLRAISDNGGVVIVQDPDQAYSSPMPRAAIGLCPEAKIMTLEQIADYLQIGTGV